MVQEMKITQGMYLRGKEALNLQYIRESICWDIILCINMHYGMTAVFLYITN